MDINIYVVIEDLWTLKQILCWRFTFKCYNTEYNKQSASRLRRCLASARQSLKSQTKSRYLSHWFWEFRPGDGPVKWRGGLKFNHGEVFAHHYTAVPFPVLSLCPPRSPIYHTTVHVCHVSVAFFNGLFLIFRDLQRIGVSLAGHQKKILTSVQLMRHNVDDQSPTESV